MVAKAQSLTAMNSSTTLSDLHAYYTPSAAQLRTLKQLVADQRTPGSANYHKWITPEQFGKQFGISTADEARVKIWLKSQGFTNVSLSKNRAAFAFAGTVSTAQTAFNTSIRSMVVNGELHYANISEIAIPDTVSDVIGGVRGLNDFKPKPMARKMAPQYTIGTDAYALVPTDIAKIYNIQQLYDAGVTGSGVTVAIVGQSDIDTNDIATYRSAWGLDSTLPTTIIAGNDPGHVSIYEVEADLDIELIGAVARGATILYYASGSVDTAMEKAIEEGKAQVVSESYGGCEVLMGSIAKIYEVYGLEANAQGMTLLASSGDTGAAGCDAATSSSAKYGPSVSAPASVPEYTAVGGTSFSSTSGYFSATNGTNGASALSYVPETSWNDTISQSHLDASGGGVSIIFTKPAWQEGTGVPADGYRDVPDVSMFSADGATNDSLGYLICEVGSCASGAANGGSWGGTSASAPVFAGIVALLNQHLVQQGALTTPGLGNINPHLYLMAANTSDVFHDITSGSNIVPCTSGTTDCPSSGSYGYSAGTGYDQVTGLGSVDAYNLVTEWNNYSLTGTTTTVVSSNISPVYGDTVTLTATVKGNSGSTTPEGTVVFYYAYADPVVSTQQHQVELGTVTLANGTASLSTSSLPTGVNSVYAAFQGSSTFSESLSPVLSVTALTPTTTSIVAGNSTWYQGSNLGFSISVTPSPFYGTYASGTVTVYSGTTSLGTATLTQGSATFTTAALPVGTDTITAVYAGNSLMAASTSSAITVTIQSTTASAVSTTTTLTASPTSLTYGGTETLTAKVAASSGSTTPTGTVTFYNGTTSLGTGTLSSGTATLTTTALPVGTDSITAVYGGTSAFSSSTSSAVTVAVSSASTTTPDFSLTASPSTLTVTAGSTASTTLTVIDAGGFTGDAAITYSCSGLPTGASCTFGTPVTTSTGSTVALSIKTAATTAQADRAPFSAAPIYTALIPAVLLLSIKRRKTFLSSLGLLSLLVVLAMGSGVVGCGSGTKGSSSSTTTPTSTTSTVTVTAKAASGTTHTTAITLTVD